MMRPKLPLALAAVALIWSCSALADHDAGLAASKRGDYATAFKEWSDSAQAGDPVSQFDLALLYTLGKGVPRDDAKAVFWFRKAADRGYADAQMELGAAYDRGKGVEHDAGEAVAWYQKAAAQKNEDAQLRLAMHYYTGEGIGKDWNAARLLLEQPGKHGNVHAQGLLGGIFFLSQDYEQAASWLSKAADQGNAHSQFLLGLTYLQMYNLGRASAQDEQQMITSFKKAAAQHHDGAKCMLDVIFPNGAPSADSKSNPTLADLLQRAHDAESGKCKELGFFSDYKSKSTH